ncbi:Hypothetical protein PHPALM_20091 [Phytophthora palmivora]|uniref:Uncharacterized protein n=1 Tax=Phytophthora palmivora TaxID=4796 RepID=A0A2P4XFR6_9STRA|nr:Hypothetical protein PHPALM_20091 [Phytophthora palmivora]
MATRNLAYPIVSRFVQHPNVTHAGALQRVLRYLVATKTHGVFYKNHDTNTAHILGIGGFVDANLGNCPDTKKECVRLRDDDGSWAGSLGGKAPNTAEAECAAASEACQEGQAIKNILIELRVKCEIVFKLGVDIQAAITLTTRSTYSRKTLYVDLRLHYVREMAQHGEMELWKVSGDENPADLLTKPMGSSDWTR